MLKIAYPKASTIPTPRIPLTNAAMTAVERLGLADLEPSRPRIKPTKCAAGAAITTVIATPPTRTPADRLSSATPSAIKNSIKTTHGVIIAILSDVLP